MHGSLRSRRERSRLSNTARRLARNLGAVLAATCLASALGGCAGSGLVASVIDYPAGVGTLRFGRFVDAEPRRTAASPSGTHYNLNHPEGRRMAAAQNAAGMGPPVTYTLAHNVAVRLRELEGAFSDAGRARPVVHVAPERRGEGWVATGSAIGDAFVAPPAAFPEPLVEVTGSLYPVGEVWEARIAIQGPKGSRQEHVIRYLDPLQSEAAGLPGWTADPRAQVLARVADLLAPHRLSLSEPDAPLAFVREVAADGAIVCDVGLERRRYRVVEAVERFDPPLGTRPGRADLAPLLTHRFVRVIPAGAADPPEHPTWIRLRVEPAG